MRILALETSGFSGSVAATIGDNLLSEIVLAPRQRTGQALAPAIQDLLKQVAWQPSDVQLVAVTQGPGSFTGLRVGITTAKSFAYALGAEVLGVDTLDVLACAVPTDHPFLSVIMNAEREQLFAASYERSATGTWQQLEPSKIVDRTKWLESLRPNMAVSGPGLEDLAELLPPETPRIAESLWRPQAAAVARIAWRDYQSGRRDDVWHLLPNYFRESAAVEKLQR